MKLPSRCLVLTLVALGTGCEGVSWPNQYHVDSLRVLGVRADPASLTADGSTRLSVICADGRRGGGQDPACNVEVAWFAACDNPERNDWTHCYERYVPWGEQLASPVADTTPETMPAGFGLGGTFEYKPASNVLTQSVSIAGRELKYGASYVFFAVCSGQLVPRTNVPHQLPVTCRDRTTGATLGQRDFVVGVTTVYSYDWIRNGNPEIAGATFDGGDIASSCDATRPCPAGFECDTEQCIPVVAPCSKEQPATCQPHCLDLGITRESFYLRGIDGSWLTDAPPKSIWFDYFTNAGRIDDDAHENLELTKEALDPLRTGCLQWQAPMAPTEHAHLWVMVRDSRGGLTAWDQRIFVR